jgi:hypothetical protein
MARSHWSGIVVSALSVLPLLLTILWIDSYWSERELSYVRNGWPRVDVHSRLGRFEIGHLGPAKGYVGPGYLTGEAGFHLTRDKPRGLFRHTWESIGFGFARTITWYLPGKRPAGQYTGVMVPYWFLVLATGVIAGIVLYRQGVRRKRRDAPVCVRCGYSLTGNVSGVCPECGVPMRADKAGEGGQKPDAPPSGRVRRSLHE